VAIGPPVVVGTSRKSFLGKLTGRPERDRVAGTIATNVMALECALRRRALLRTAAGQAVALTRSTLGHAGMPVCG